MTVALAALFVGGILVYAGLKGRSVKAMLLGDNTRGVPNASLNVEGSSGGSTVAGG